MDRNNRLKEGQVININKIEDIKCSDSPQFSEVLQNHFNSLFVDGVTTHGDQYFASGGDFIFTSPLIELLFEYVRKANFRDKPSRAQSVFALENLNDIKRLADMFRCNLNQVSVWEVECEEYHKANMNMLKILSSNLVTSYFANEYWSGNTGLDPNPFWEYLLVPPVKIIKKIN